MYDYDDIDRALFSLQLEEPPEDLRSSIFAVTVQAPVEALPAWPFSALEIGGLAVVLAFAAWLTAGVFAGHAWVANLESAARMLGTVLTNPSVLAWLGAGASTAVWLSLTTFTPLAGARTSRA